MGYNQANNPFSRKASPLNAQCPKGWTVNPDKDGPACLPPKKGKPAPEAEPRKKKEGPSRISSSPLNQVEEQVYEHELGHDEMYEDPRSGENYLAQESYENPGYDEYGGKIRGKLGRKERKLQKVKEQLLEASEPSPQKKMSKKKWDRKIDKGIKTQLQIKTLKENQ